MKRIGIWILVLMILLSGCGKPEESKKSEYSGNNYAIGEKIVEIVDKYLDFEISAEEAYDTVYELYERLSKKTENDGPMKIRDGHIHSSTRLLVLRFQRIQYDDGLRDQEILEARNGLASALDIEKR